MSRQTDSYCSIPQRATSLRLRIGEREMAIPLADRRMTPQQCWCVNPQTIPARLGLPRCKSCGRQVVR